jgi:VIT1/CCC1 family predicted Fe2+/Mn2+ transporter
MNPKRITAKPEITENPPGRKDLARYRANMRDEIDAAFVYRAMATAEKDPERASLFRELAAIEEGHAAFWRERLEKAGVRIPSAPSLRARILRTLARRFGARSILATLAATETKAEDGYLGQPEARAANMPAQERSHAKVFREMAKNPGARIGEKEAWHRSSAGGGLRAAVFGANDGLVSNFSLLMGVAGGTHERGVILLAGMAGMLAGAFSMAAGEYVSVRSQRELFEREIEKEREELETNPEDEARELEFIYRAKGLPADQAKILAASILETPGSALDTLVREELGLDPSELGSPWTAAYSSFFAFVAGAILPLLPFFFLADSRGVWTSAGISGVALFGIGASLSIFTGKGALFSGSRMLLIGGSVALVTNLIGRLVGVSIS